METKKKSVTPGKRPKDQAQSQPWTLGNHGKLDVTISHLVTQSAFFYAVDTVIGERMELNFEVVINSVPVPHKAQYLS
jgi:aromatic ring-cleaving dioxygenase